jgi:ATP-dependent Lon protease
MTTSPKPLKRLPEHPSEENLRKQARRLANEKGLQLAAAQRKLAIEYGYQNWGALMQAVKDRFVPFLPLCELIAFPHEAYPIYIGRPKSIAAVEAASNGKIPILLVAQRDAKLPRPTAADMYEVGTLGTVDECVRLGDGTIKAIIVGTQRARVSEFVFDQDFYKAKCVAIRESAQHSPEFGALIRSVAAAFPMGRPLMEELKTIQSPFAAIADPAFLSDKMVGHLKMPIEEKQALLEMIDPVKRLEKILAHLNASQ